MKLRTTSLAAATALMVIAGAGHAALVKNGDGTTTDTLAKLIWLQNLDFIGAELGHAEGLGRQPGLCRQQRLAPAQL